MCYALPVFSAYCDDTSVPHASQMRGWLDDSMQRVQQAAPGDQYQADVEPLLPATAGAFFSFHASADHATTSTLQRTLNAKAAQHTVEAAIQRMKEQVKQGRKREWAHHKAITAKAAWG